MTTITASLVKELRARTGVGMMECKKALVEANGDIENAIEMMRKSGQAAAVKRASKTTAEGKIVVMTSLAKDKAVIIEINSETDFVAKEKEFGEFTEQVARQILANNLQDINDIGNQAFNASQTIEEARQSLVVKLGENISIRRIKIITASGIVGYYLHNQGGIVKIGAVVAIDSKNEELAKELAMHVAAMNPEYLTIDEVPDTRISKEKSIFQAQEQESNKPDNIKEKIIEGKVNKFLQGITLMGQQFVKDSKTPIEQLMKDKKTNITSFARFEVGEGIEKKANNFLEDVMSQVHGS